MKKTALISSAVLFCVLCAFPALCKTDDYPEGKIKILGKRYSVAVNLGFAALSDQGSKNTFGDGEWSYGLNLFRPATKEGAQFDCDIHFKDFKEGDNSAKQLGLSAGIHYNFADPEETNTVPFFEVHAGPYWTKWTNNKSEIVPGANAVLGIELSKTVKFSVRYDWLDKVEGVDMSSWSAGVTVKVY